jgi:hypothetical protein
MIRMMSAAVAMMGATVLIIPTFTLLLPNDAAWVYSHRRRKYRLFQNFWSDRSHSGWRLLKLERRESVVIILDATRTAGEDG